ncbi:SagB/ThcOx family dehydrogenase [Methylocystis rosea]|uniref:SagB/ThcOx family dehydrogenase n=1 Tax=Methylocystis rosea TaxID=173366 RepID=A0A3G8M0M2_9HYPH|nr:SagB family peptide dehydrogenase [Methylocystis rosea]AZG75451.1 SagB/ThcOx family dehydrogenase [Methylocystis rosea]
MPSDTSQPPARLFARLNPGVTLERNAAGGLTALFDGRSVEFGKFGADVTERAADFDTGVAFDGEPDDEMSELVRRLALYGLVEYRLARAPSGPDLIVVEPQMRDYAPRMIEIDEDCALTLSRFAYMRRRGADMVLESPRACALFRLCDPSVAAMIAHLSEARTVRELRDSADFPGVELLALLLDGEILFTPGPGADKALRAAEGDEDLVLWDFHDLLFHARSTNGRHANPSGGIYAHAHLAALPPAVRPSWPGPAIDLKTLETAPPSAFATLLRRRRSIRVFDEQRPITLTEVARLLDGAARIISRKRKTDEDEDESEVAPRPYPSGGASYELELYLAVDRCEGLARGFYHYDANQHALVLIETNAHWLTAMLEDAQFAMGAPAVPQVLMTMSARFSRVSWKYSGFAYALVLKHVGVLMQTLYLMATEMEIGACAVGVGDIDLFAKMTGLAFHVEGSVGQIAIGRGVQSDSTPLAD